MADEKLSSLTQGLKADFYYGIESSASRKYAGDGIFNVKNYGAVGDFTNDDTSAIQAAIDAATTAHGGTVYFPPGFYKITQALTVLATGYYGIILKGAGSPGSGNAIYGYGSTISSPAPGGFADYLIRTIHLNPGGGGNDNCVVGLIEDLGFNNNYNSGVDLTSTEVASGGHGCIYLTTGSKFIIRNCSCNFNTGIGLFCTAQTTHIDNCSFQAQYAFTNAGRSIGVFLANGIITGGAITNCGIAAMQAVDGAGYFGIENIDCEGNGSVCVIGYSTIAYWAIENSTIHAAGPSTCDGGFIRKLQGESNGSTDNSGLNSLIYIGNVSNLSVESVKFANISVRANYGLYIYQAAGNCSFQNMYIAGSVNSFDVAAVALAGEVAGCRFVEVFAEAGSAATGVNFQSYGTGFNAGKDGNAFEYCNFDGAVTMDPGGGQNVAFPSLPTASGQLHWVTDCRDSVWLSSTSVSNVGKPVSAGMTTSSSTPAGNNTLNFTSGSIATQISTDGTWKVINPGGVGIQGGTTVTAISSNTVTMSNNALAAGVDSGAGIAFLRGGGTNKTLLRWTGTYLSSGNNGAWCVAG